MNKKMCFSLVLCLALALGWALWALAAEANPALLTQDPRFGGWNTELVSQFWGTFNAIEVNAGYAYVCQGQRFSVFDISTPGSILQVGQSEVMTNDSDNLEVAGDYAYLADPGISDGVNVGSRLHILNISDPADPYEAAYLENDGYRAFDIRLFDGFAYLANGNGLWVVDLSDPLNPASVTRMSISGGTVRRVHVAYHVPTNKAYAYLLVGDYLVVVDITDPANPVRRTDLEVGPTLLAIELDEDRAYIIDDIGALHVIDISNPLLLSETAATPSDTFTFGKIEIRGDTLFISDDGDGVHILDASGTGLPLELGLYPLSDYVSDLAVLPGQPKVFVSTYPDLRAIDVTVPSVPVEAGSYHQEGSIPGTLRSGDYLYVSRGQYFPDSVEAYAFSDLENPVKAGSLPVPAYVNSIVGDNLYLLREINWDTDPLILPALVVADIHDPTALSVTDVFTGTGNYVVDVAVFGNRAYLAERSEGLHIIDVSDPHDLQEIAVYNRGDGIYSVSVATPANEPSKTYAYLGTEYSGLVVLDVTDPYSISEKGSIGGGWGAEVEFIAVYAPTQMTGPLPAAGYYIALVDSYFTRLVDVSNPEAPTLLGTYGLLDWGRDLAVQGDYLYVAAGLKGVRILKYDGIELDEYGYYRLPFMVYDVAVSGDFLHLSARSDGLFNVWFGPSSEVLLETSGGIMDSSFHSSCLTFPSGAYTNTVILTYTPRYQGNMPSQPGLTGIGVYYELSAWDDEHGLFLSPTIPYQFELNYDEADLSGMDENDLGLYYWNGSAWVKEPSSSVDPDTNILTAETMHVSLVAVMVGDDQNRLFLPALLR